MACNGLWYFQVDEQLASGEYFMSQKKKSAKKWQDKLEKQAQKTAENKRKRDAAFIPPEVDSEPIQPLKPSIVGVMIHALLIYLISYPNDFYQFGMTTSGDKKPGYEI